MIKKHNNNNSNNNSMPERYRMTTIKDANMTIDMLSAIGPPPHYKDQDFWLTPEQAAFLKNIGVSFAKHHVKKWVPDNEWD